MALGEIFGGCDVVEGGDPAFDEGIHPSARPGNGMQQGVACLWIDCSMVRGRVCHALLELVV